jgi:hypothetical protein
MMKKINWIAMALICATALVACPTPPASTPTPTQEPVGDPIIPATTKVADSDTRSSLQAYDSQSGQMRFGKDSPVLQNLAVGDVLASEVSKNAPYGYLRKVSSIKRENGQVILETTQASLEEAISHGDIDANFELKPEDLVSAKALVPGVTVGLAPQTKKDGLSPQAEGSIGDGMNYRVVINESWLEVEGSTPGSTVTAKITLSGEAYFNIGYQIKASIRGPSFIPPRLPKLEYIEGSAQIEQRARIKVSGEATGRIAAEKKIAEYQFTPVTVMVGIVPIIVVPTVFAKIGIAGELKFSFEYAAEQRASSLVGVRWDSDKGWIKFDGNPQLSVQTQDQVKFDTGLLAEAYTKAETALLLYRAAGPILKAKAAFQLDAAFPRNPTWILRGKLEGEYGFVVDLPVFGRLAESTDKLFKLEKEFARSPNTPPKLNVYQTSRTIQLGQKLNSLVDCAGGFQVGFAAVSDAEDGCSNVSVSATSSLEGALTPNHVFQRAGQHVITLTAKDPQGATATANLNLNVVNTAPTIKIEYPDNIIEGEDLNFTAIVQDPNEPSNGLCSRVVWTVTAPDVVSSTTGCTVKIRFPRVGQRSVTARVTDNQSASAQASATLTVQASPSNPYPRIKTSGVYSRERSGSGFGITSCLGVDVTNGSTIDLRARGCTNLVLGPNPQPNPPRYFGRAEIDNPSNETLRYDWRMYVTGPLGETQIRNAIGSSESSFDLNNVGNSGLETLPCRLTLKVNAPEANRSRGPITVWSGQCTYNPAQIN